jgi:hypothetical protein
MTGRRALAAVSLGLIGVAGASPAAAHGIGGRTDLPLPAWQLAWAAGFAVASSFVALGVFWAEPRLEQAAEGKVLLSVRGRVGQSLLVVTRLIGLVLFAVLLWSAWWGHPNGAVNIAGPALLIWFWVGLQMVSFVFGDVWRLFNPYLAVAAVVDRIHRRRVGPDGDTSQADHRSLWTAAVAIFAYLWFELAYHSPDSPRAIGVFLTGYSLVMVGGVLRYGSVWVDRADGFAVLFTKLATIAPLYVDPAGNLRVRTPLAGLSRLRDVAGLVPFVLVVLGSTTFDGFTRSSLWLQVSGNATGWQRTVTFTIGLLVVVGLVAMVYSVAISVMASITGDRASELSRLFGPTLVPIAAAYAVAHYFSLLVLDGQQVIARLSDPAGRGSDWFGTVDYTIDWTLVSPGLIAWVQTLAIAVGHVLAVAAAHDLAIARYRHDVAVRSQYPMLAVMILYTVLGLFLLLGA